MSKKKPNYLVSTVLSDGRIVEIVYSQQNDKTSLAVFDGTKVEYLDKISFNDRDYEPYPASKNLISRKVVLLPEEAIEYTDDKILIQKIQEFIHSYLDINSVFERIATYYVLFTWVYDGFGELPYLRVLGDYGSGKSRFLKVIGSICYKPMFTGGATTVSPVFRTIDYFRGTLMLDEADFKQSDTTAEIVKILNCGYQRGNPVLRCSEGKDGNYDVVPFDVFCPKIIATRKKFDDIALESRCLTTEFEKKQIRNDIPINIPKDFDNQALELRNQLLLWRFRNLGQVSIKTEDVDRTIEPRLAQIMTPLLSIIADDEVKADICKLAKEYNQEFAEDKYMSFESEIFGTILECFEDGLVEPTMKDVASRYNEVQTERDKLSSKRMGYIVRKQLKFRARRTNQGYVVSEAENTDRVALLKRRYGYEGVAETAPVNLVNEVNVNEQGAVANDIQLPF